MIVLYSGNTGSGKTLHAMRDIVLADRDDNPIVVNFEVNLRYIENKDRVFVVENADLTPQYLQQFSQDYWCAMGERVEENRILLVIDECQLLFNARSWTKNFKAGWGGFFSQHRKMGYKIILITQSDKFIDTQVRTLIEFEYKHRKISNGGPFGVFLSVVFGSRFLVKKEWYAVRSMGKGAALGWRFLPIYGKCYKLYDTFKTWDSVPQTEKEVVSDVPLQVKKGG